MLMKWIRVNNYYRYITRYLFILPLKMCFHLSMKNINVFLLSNKLLNANKKFSKMITNFHNQEQVVAFY